MLTFDGEFEVYDEDDIDLLKVRRTRVNCLKPYQYYPPPETRTQATPSHKHLFEESLHHFRSKTLPTNSMNEETDATPKRSPVDDIMSYTMAELAEKGVVKLPSLHQFLPERDHTPEPEDENIPRPYYNHWTHGEGFVAWWDNRTGKGMIVDHRYNLEHKIELKDIKWSNYGALVPGSMVEYEYSEEGYSKGFSKFWVVSGCEYVL